MANDVDYSAIAAAMTLRFTAPYVAAPAGLDAMRSANYLTPAGLHTPCVVAFFQGQTNIQYDPGMMVTSTLTWIVRFYLSEPADYARVLDKLNKWGTVLQYGLDGQVQLGLSYVNSAQITNVGPFGELPFDTAPGAHGYPGFEMTVDVHVKDNRNFVA